MLRTCLGEIKERARSFALKMHKTSDDKEKLIYKTENPSSAEGLPIFFFSDVPHLNPQKRTGSTS